MKGEPPASNISGYIRPCMRIKSTAHDGDDLSEVA